MVKAKGHIALTARDWASAVTAIAVLGGVLGQLIVSFKAISRVEEVKTTLADVAVTAEENQKIGIENHKLANSHYEASLLVAKAATKRTADVTKDPADVEIAKLAAQTYDDQVKTTKELRQ